MVTLAAELQDVTVWHAVRWHISGLLNPMLHKVLSKSSPE